MHEVSAVELAVGLAALLIGGAGGYAAGRWAPRGTGAAGAARSGAAGSGAPGTAGNGAAGNGAAGTAIGEPADGGLASGQPPERAGAAAARDWAEAERGRPCGSPETERDSLIAACANLADRLRDRQQALYAGLARDLAAAGVELQAPDGERFDAGLHNAVGTEPAATPAQDLLVAETTRLGYRHHGIQVRVPDVIVYRWKES
jgi:GrpE